MSFQANQLTQAANFLNSFNPPTYQCRHNIITVSGIQEAKDFKLNNGESAAMIDSNADILYIKECDSIGKCSLKVYECIDKTEEYLNIAIPANLSKAEIDSLKNDLAEVKSLLLTKLGGKENGKYDVQK